MCHLSHFINEVDDDDDDDEKEDVTSIGHY